MNSIICTERLNLRHWVESDITSLIQMNKDEDVMRYFPSIMSDDESISFYDRINKHYSDYGYGLFVVEEKVSNKFLGYTGFMMAQFESSFTPCVEIGWRFNKENWGNGFATEAAKACLEYGFAKLNFIEVHSFTSVLNKKSEAVMQRIGMSKVGEFNHPKVSMDSQLRLHVNYSIKNYNPSIS